MIPERIRKLERWCVSKDKIPKDMYALERGMDWGVSTRRSHSCYVDYAKARQVGLDMGLPVTLWVDAAEQAMFVVDIEKTCPAEIRRAMLLSLHGCAEYLETSLSGKGFHLMVRTDALPSLKTAKYRKWFECLSQHHCTFTGNEISFQDAYAMDVPENEPLPEDERSSPLMEAMKRPLTALQFYDTISSTRDPVQIDSGDLSEYRAAVSGFDGRHADLFNALCDMDYLKTVDKDFHGDYSAYEFGYASKLMYRLLRLASDMLDADACHYELELTKEEAVMLVYMALKQCVAPRDKHAERRNGLPWLLYTAERVYAKTFS